MDVFEVALLFGLYIAMVTGTGHDSLTPPYTCTTTTTLCQPGGAQEKPALPPTREASVGRGRDGKRGVEGEKGAKGEKGDPCQCKIADEDAMEAMNRKVERLEQRMEQEYLEMKQEYSRTLDTLTPANCSEVRKHFGSDDISWAQIYPLKSIGDLTPLTVPCTEDLWIVIQRRLDGSVDFYRDWESYASGFGNRNSEFWLGLRTIHSLTSSANYKLRIDLKFKDGSVKYVEYSTFRVGSEDSAFRLTISGYSGNARDSMASHNGQGFSTKDRDHDQGSSRNCAQQYQGAWWYHTCYQSNLNGEYKGHFIWGGITLISYSEMKILPV